MSGLSETPGLIAEPDVYAAVYDFILAYALPALSPDNIIRGWENREHLPPDTNDYAIMTVMNKTRVGTNVTMDAGGDAEAQEIRTLRRIDVQIDFCSDDDKAMRRAACIETVTRDPVGVAFFKPYRLSCLYAEDVRAVEYVDGSDQFVKRCIVTLHLAAWSGLSVPVPHFDKARVSRLENVDVHHKPSQES